MSYMDTYKQWCTDSYFDEDTREIRQRSRTVSTVSSSSAQADSAVSSVREPTG